MPPPQYPLLLGLPQRHGGPVRRRFVGSEGVHLFFTGCFCFTPSWPGLMKDMVDREVAVRGE